MASCTIIMYFKVSPSHLDENNFQEILQKFGSVCLEDESVSAVPVDFGKGFKLLTYIGRNKSHATLHAYQNGLLTLDIHHFFEDLEKVYTFTTSQISSQHQKLRDLLGHYCTESKSLLAPIKLGMPVWPYVSTGDERLMETDYDRTLCEVKSEFQTIAIHHSKQNGNVLHLDCEIMLGESDLIYTQTLCRIGSEDFTDKEVLILGGGDGGILHELLKEKPKFITMAEIDEMVIQCCRTHMREVCGSDMDKLEGPNYKIVIDDCLNVLMQKIEQGQLLDYVINDLTEFPVSKDINGFAYDFKTARTITELAVKSLKPNGKLLARGDCVSYEEYHSKFENDLKKLGCHFNRTEVYVPSFLETYSFYEISKK